MVGLMSWLVVVDGRASPAAIIWARVEEWEMGGSTGFSSTDDVGVLLLLTVDVSILVIV